MALEATLLVELEPAVSFTCADGAGIEKGAILKIADPNTVSIAGTDNDPVIGIAAEEKIANDGKTQIAVYLRGIFKGTAGAAGVTAGNAIICDASTGDNNEIVNADVNSENIIGRALETATDLQTFKFLLQPLAVNLA
jgi:hypothetical protein